LDKLDKTVPANAEAEEAVLGSLLIDPDAVLKVASFLQDGDFYRERNGWIYRAILDLHERRDPADFVTLCDELERRDILQEVGGAAYITQLINNVPSAAYVEHYGRIVERTATLRRLIEAAGQVAALAYEEAQDVDEVVDRAEQIIFNVAERRVKRDLVPVRQVMHEVVDRIEYLHRHQGQILGVPSGFTGLDRLLGGFQKSDLIILAARPAVGKTSLSLNFALNAARRFKKVVAYFSLEMSAEQLVQRLLAMETGIDQQRLRKGEIEDHDWDMLMAAAGELAGTMLYIDDTPAMSALELRTKARRLQAEHGLDLVVVDYLQLMRGDNRSENRVQEISYISRALKGLARELECPVIALSQLSRAVESRTDHKPMLSDLRESGCLLADARILRADTGAEVTIGELVLSQETPLVWSIDEQQRLRPARLSRAFPTGIKPVFRVQLASGRSVDASANHPFLTVEGWTRLDQLETGSFVATPRILPPPVCPSTSDWSDDRIILLAHLLGDGTMGSSFKYATADAQNKQAVMEAVKREFGIDADDSSRIGRTWQVWFPSPYRLTHNVYHPMRLWLEPLGLFESRAWTKFVPDLVFGLPDDKITLFLRHLWATDGCITITKNGRGSLVSTYYATTSRQLALDVQRLLLRLGIISTIGKGQKARTTGELYRPGYNVRIQGAANQLRFLQLAGCHGERGASIPEAVCILSGIKENPNNDLVPWPIAGAVKNALRASEMTQRGLAAELGEQYCGAYLLGTAQRPRRFSRGRLLRMGEATGSQQLVDYATSDLFWDEVIEITPLGDKPTFDLTVDGTHNFLANGIVVHNSIEQDSDIVMFIYREDMHKENSDKKNIADIIVAKHRNGPTDSIPLYFRRELTKFENLEMVREPLNE
jgi:replicative DNA helicase